MATEKGYEVFSSIGKGRVKAHNNILRCYDISCPRETWKIYGSSVRLGDLHGASCVMKGRGKFIITYLGCYSLQ